MTKEMAYTVVEALEKKFAENDRPYWEVGAEHNVIRISITWGDWKHDHLYARFLVEEVLNAMGIQFTYTDYITEEDGSDCYSADHLIRF